MKKIFFIISLSFFIQTAFAQEKAVLSTSGNTQSNTNVILDWTLGETFIGNFSNAQINLSQGFQDFQFFVSAIESENSFLQSKVKIFPNPAIDFIQCSISDHHYSALWTVDIFDLSGKKILSENYSTNLFKIRLNQLHSQNYVMKISHQQKKYIASTFSIVIVK